MQNAHIIGCQLCCSIICVTLSQAWKYTLVKKAGIWPSLYLLGPSRSNERSIFLASVSIRPSICFVVVSKYFMSFVVVYLWRARRPLCRAHFDRSEAVFFCRIFFFFSDCSYCRSSMVSSRTACLSWLLLCLGLVVLCNCIILIVSLFTVLLNKLNMRFNPFMAKSRQHNLRLQDVK